MTMRAWGVLALVVTTTLALIAGMLTLGPYGVPDSSFLARDPSALSPRRGVQAPMIIAPPMIDLEPSSHAPLLIEIGPPEWVPHDSTLLVQGLPPSVSLSHGQRVSSKLWAVAIAALSKVRIDVAANAAAGQSDATLTLVASDGSHIAEAHTTITIDALAAAAAKQAAVSPPHGPGATSPPATAEASPGEHAPSERKASGTAPGTPSDQRASGQVIAAGPMRTSVAASRDIAKAPIANAKGGPATPTKDAAQTVHPLEGEEVAAQREGRGASGVADKEAMPAAKGAAVVVQREAPVAPPEPEKLAATAASEGAGIAAAKGVPKQAAKGDAQSVHPILGEEIASQFTIKGVAAAPANKGAPREVVVASSEAARPSMAVSEAAGPAAAKGGPATPAKGAAQSARSVDREENAAQREANSALVAPAGKEPAPAFKGPAGVAPPESASSAPASKQAAPSPEGPAAAVQHQPVVASQLAKPSGEASAAAGLDEPNGGPTTSVKGNLASAHPVAREEIAARPAVTSASPVPAGKQVAPSPEGSAAAAAREPVVASELMKPSVAASSEVTGLAKPNGGPAASASSDASIAHPAEREVVPQRGLAAAGDKEPPPPPENAAGLAGAKAGPATPARSAPSGQSVPGEENAAQRQGRGVAAAADKVPVPSHKEPMAVAVLEPVVASPEPAKPSSAASEAAGVKAEPSKPVNNDAQGLHAILGEEIASQREIKSAFAAPVDADAARGNASRGDLREGERYVARGEASLAAGNVAVAREFFLRAVDAGAARGALLLASTYDPYELVGLHVIGVQPNIDLARRWYKRAEALGEKHASERITRLERR